MQGPDAKRLKTESYLAELKQALSEESLAMFKVLLQAYSKVHTFCIHVSSTVSVSVCVCVCVRACVCVLQE